MKIIPFVDTVHLFNSKYRVNVIFLSQTRYRFFHVPRGLDFGKMKRCSECCSYLSAIFKCIDLHLLLIVGIFHSIITSKYYHDPIIFWA